jgi:hypothetical protein
LQAVLRFASTLAFDGRARFVECRARRAGFGDGFALTTSPDFLIAWDMWTS